MNIKSVRFCILALVLSIGVCFSNAQATTINDGYVGGTPTNPADFGKDVIGLFERYDVSKMEVNFDIAGNNLTVGVYSQFFDNVGVNGIELGDLFMSFDGWNPFGSAPYNNDNAGNGESWEGVLVLDDHGEGASPNGESYVGRSGVLTGYGVNPAGIEYSSLPGLDFRAKQEVQYNQQRQDGVTGRWGIFEKGTYDLLLMTIHLPFDLAKLDPGTTWGFHWTMTCANDVIEGEAPIPEPGTLALFGAALLGGLPFRKRAKKDLNT